MLEKIYENIFVVDHSINAFKMLFVCLSLTFVFNVHIHLLTSYKCLHFPLRKKTNKITRGLIDHVVQVWSP